VAARPNQWSDGKITTGLLVEFAPGGILETFAGIQPTSGINHQRCAIES
jgi:hypothetical protein